MKRILITSVLALTLVVMTLMSANARTLSQSFWFPDERLITSNLGGFLLHLPTTTANKNGSFDGWHNPDPNEVFRTMRWGTSVTEVFTDTQGVTHTLESLVQTEMQTWEDTTTAIGLTWLDISNTSASPSSTWHVEVKLEHCPDDITAAACVTHDAFNEIPLEDTAPWTKATLYLHPNLVNDPIDFAKFVIRHEIGHLHALNDVGAVTSIMSSSAWTNGHLQITNKDEQSLKYYFGSLGKYDVVDVYNEPIYPWVVISYNDWVPNGWSKECHVYQKQNGDWVWLNKEVESDNVGTYASVDAYYTPYTTKVLTCEPNVGFSSGEYKVHVFEVIGVDDLGAPVRVLANVTEFTR